MRVTKAQLGTMTDFKITGGTFGTYYSQIKRAGLIIEEDGLIAASEAGIDFAGVVPQAPMTTGDPPYESSAPGRNNEREQRA